MPREMYVLSKRAVDFEALVVAGAHVDDQLALRTLYEGAAWQLVDRDDVAVLTISSSRELKPATDAARVTRGLPGAGAEVDLWWTEATAPWGAAGEHGVAIVQALAGLIDGQVRVEDGR